MTSADPDPGSPDVPQAPDGTATAWGATAAPAPPTTPSTSRTAGTDSTLPTTDLDPRLNAENPPTETPPGEASTTRDLAFREEKTASRAWGTGSLAAIAVIVLAVAVFLVAKLLDLL